MPRKKKDSATPVAESTKPPVVIVVTADTDGQPGPNGSTRLIFFRLEDGDCPDPDLEQMLRERRQEGRSLLLAGAPKVKKGQQLTLTHLPSLGSEWFSVAKATR